MTDEDFIKPDPEQLLKKFQALQQKRTKKNRDAKREPTTLFSSDVSAWYQGNRDNWCSSDHTRLQNDDFDDGGYDQPPPDFYFRVKYDLIREKIEELLMLLFNFESQTMLDSIDCFVDEFIIVFFGNIVAEVMKK